MAGTDGVFTAKNGSRKIGIVHAGPSFVIASLAALGCILLILVTSTYIYLTRKPRQLQYLSKAFALPLLLMADTLATVMLPST